jgi:hypothetical protein
MRFSRRYLVNQSCSTSPKLRSVLLAIIGYTFGQKSADKGFDDSEIVRQSIELALDVGEVGMDSLLSGDNAIIMSVLGRERHGGGSEGGSR